MTKVFFLINSLDTGGSERVVTELAHNFAKKADVKIILLKNVNKQAVKVPVLPLSDFTGNAAPFFLAKVLKKKFKELVEREKPDVVISFLELSNLINIQAREELKEKYRCVISVRANPSYVYKKGIYGIAFKRLIRKFYPKADLVITNSQLSKMDLCQNFGISESKSVTVYNPVNLQAILDKSREKIPAEFEKIFAKGNKVIINVGRLTYLKGQDHLLRAFSLIRAEEKNAKLVLVGGGELREALEKEAKKLNISEDVFFVGEQSNPYKFISKSNLFVFTSLYEGFPNAVLEAMACKTPIVSVDCRSGPREMLAPKTDPFSEAKGVEMAECGVLVPSFGYIKDAKEINNREHVLKQAIVKVLNSQILLEKYGRAGFERVKAFDAAKIADDFYKAGVLK